MDDSIIKQTALRQYRAGLAMLDEAIKRCPEEVWYSSVDTNRFWHIVYHSLFYTHLYVQQSEGDFRPWSKHVPGVNYLGPQPGSANESFRMPEAYSKADLQEYLEVCRDEVERQLPLVRLEDGSGFSWLPFNKLELQFYNIRHLQHHTGQLIERIRKTANTGVGWVGSRSAKA